MVLQEFLKANKSDKLSIFAAHCKDPEHFYYHKGGLMTYSQTAARMICVIEGIRSKKE